MNGFVDEAGNPIADEQIGAALESGQLRALPGTRVHMLDGAGRPVTVAAEDAGQALQAGFTPEGSSTIEARQRGKEFGGAGQQAIAGLEGAARGLSFGLSDVALTSLGGEGYRRNAQARQEVNPITAGASELGGAVAPLLLTGGASAGASLGSRALTAIPRASTALGRLATGGIRGETTLARMAARAAETGTAGAFEGMLYGAGSAAGQAALAGNQITAEKVLSGGAHGALIGGLLGAGAGAVSGRFGRSGSERGDDLLLKKKLDKLDESLSKQAKADERAAARASGELERAERRGGLLDRIAADQAMQGLKPGPRTLGRYAKTPAEVDSLLQEAGQDYLQYQIRTGPLAGKRIFHGARDPSDALGDITHAFNETDDIVRAHKQTASETIAANPDLAPDLSEISGRVEGELLEKLGAPETKRLAKHLAPLNEARDLQRQFGPVGGAELDALEATRQNLIDAAEKATRPSEVRALRSARLSVDDAIRDATEGALQKAGVDTTLFRNEARMHRSLSLIKDAAEELKVSQFASKGGLENNAAGYALAAALSGNFAGTLAVGATMFGQNLLRNRASGIVAELAHRVSKSDVRLGWGAKALSGDGFRYPVRTAITKSLTGAAAERFFSRLSGTASDARQREDYVVAQTSDVAKQYPELAVAMQQTIAGDLQYLASKIPARYSRSSASITPMATKPVGSKASADDFWETVHALEDPGYVVDEMLNGRVPTAAIEALKERRPNEWERLRSAVMTECAARGEELPFKRRITLGTAFDFTSDRSLLPGAILNIQTSFMPKEEPGRPQSSGAIKAQEGTIADMQLSGDTV